MMGEYNNYILFTNLIMTGLIVIGFLYGAYLSGKIERYIERGDKE